MPEDRSFVTHLECSLTGEAYPADRAHGLSAAGKPLLVRYDLDAIARTIDKDTLRRRSPDFWRYREFLPLVHEDDAIRLGETMTPLVSCERLASASGVTGRILIKDEGRLPTGSFKARGLALAVAMARHFGVERLAMPTNGNAGAAMAAYAARGGMESYVFCPSDTPEINVREIAMYGAKVFRVDGLIDDCGRIVHQGKEAMGWFDVSTLKEPYRIEGKKTMGLELAEQLDWELPDAIFYPTGGGTGLIGMWKAFDELERIGWIGAKRPRMIAVQASGCAPIVRAYEKGEEHAERWQGAHTIASGIRVPAALGDFLILRAVRESKGFAIAVDDEAIEAARTRAAQSEGVLLCPEGAATLAAYLQALDEQRVSRGDRVVLFNCGSGLKYPMPDRSHKLEGTAAIDWRALAGS